MGWVIWKFWIYEQIKGIVEKKEGWKRGLCYTLKIICKTMVSVSVFAFPIVKLSVKPKAPLIGAVNRRKSDYLCLPGSKFV